MTTSLPPRQPLSAPAQRAFQDAVHQQAVAVASPFLPPVATVFDVWSHVVHTQEEYNEGAFHHWPEEFVAYFPTHWTLAQLHAHLAMHAQTLHVNFPPHWTLAQAVVYAPALASDAWQMPLRQCILGLHWLNVHGELISSGGRVLKNVTGYDLHRLHLGFHGTLGLPIGVCLRTAPLPKDPQRHFRWETPHPAFHLLEQRLKMAPPTGLKALIYHEETAYLTWQGSDELLETCFVGLPLNEQAQAFTAPLAPLWAGEEASLWPAQLPQALWQQWRDLRRAWGIAPHQLRSPYFDEEVYHAEHA